MPVTHPLTLVACGVGYLAGTLLIQHELRRLIPSERWYQARLDGQVSARGAVERLALSVDHRAARRILRIRTAFSIVMLVVTILLQAP